MIGTLLTERRSPRAVWFALAVVLVHTSVLFIAMPRFASRFGGSVNHNLYADGYDLLASNLAAGNGYRFYPNTARTLMREPGYPLLLAGLFLTCGRDFVSVELTNVLLALGTAWLILSIARKLDCFQGKDGARSLRYLAPVVWLIHPGTFVAESRGGVEMLFAFLLTLFTLMLLWATDSGSTWAFMSCGIVLGVTLLVRSTPLLFPCVLFLYLSFYERNKRRVAVVARNVTAMVVAMVIVLLPWIGRNYVLTGKCVPTASVLGVSAQAGEYIGERLFSGKAFYLLDREAARERDRVAERLGLAFQDGKEGYYQTFFKSEDEVFFSKFLLNQVFQIYMHNPWLFARCVFENAVNFWIAGKTWTITAATAIVQIPYLCVAAMGAVAGLRSAKRKLVGVVLLVVLYIMSVHAPILAQARYSIPVNPMVSVCVWLGVASIHRKVISRRAGSGGKKEICVS